MAKTTTKSTKKDTTTKEVKESVPNTKQETKVAKIKKNIPDTALVNVKSNVFGELIYVNHKTGDETLWDNVGDIQQLTMGDLRAMKAGNRAFYVNNWIHILSVEDEDFFDVEPEEIYKQLQVFQYYKNSLCPENINEVFNWSNEDIKNKVPLMNSNIRMNLVVAANQLIKDGIIDSYSKIKALEDAFDCELGKME